VAAKYTKSEVAEILEQFLDGTVGAWDWDDFTSIRIADPELEAIRVRCVELYDSTTSGQYCGPEGVAEMRRMVDQLRGSH
jgi:hypothetical protein